MSSFASPFARPLYVMVKPVGSVCNLACEYCYYLEKGNLYPEKKTSILSDELLDKFIQDYQTGNYFWNSAYIYRIIYGNKSKSKSS